MSELDLSLLNEDRAKKLLQLNAQLKGEPPVTPKVRPKNEMKSLQRMEERKITAGSTQTLPVVFFFASLPSCQRSTVNPPRRMTTPTTMAWSGHTLQRHLLWQTWKRLLSRRSGLLLLHSSFTLPVVEDPSL